MIILPELYEHQCDLKDRTRAALAKHRRVIMCQQTGTGKTRIAKWILGASANREPGPKQSGKSLFAVYMKGLVDNASDSFNEEPAVPHGIIRAGVGTSYGERIQIASIDTMLSWFIENGNYPSDITFDLLCYDECHSHGPKFARFLKHHDERREQLGLNPAYVIGLSATPQAKGLADVYREIVTGRPTTWLIENGFLAPYRYFEGTPGNLGLLVKKGGEFTPDSEAAAMKGLAGDLVKDWKRFAEGLPTVGFFANQSLAQDGMERLSKAGLRVEYVDCNTPDDKRRSIFKALYHHSIDYLANVDIVGRGTDITSIACVQLCVAIGSLTAYRQKIGRGARIHPGKKDCLVLDHGGNVLRHGFFEDDVHWNLDITEKDPGEQGTRPTICCPACDRLYRGGKCTCGYEPTPKERRSQGLEFDGSELREVKREEKPKSTAKTAEQLMVSAMFRAGRSGKTWSACFAIFKKSCEENGTPQYRVPKTVLIAGHRYKCLRYDSDDKHRRVSHLFPVTVGGGHGGDYLVQEQASEEVQW